MHANQTYEGTLQNTMEPIGIVVDWLKTNSGKIILLIVVALLAAVIDKALTRIVSKVLDRSQVPNASIFINILRAVVWTLAVGTVLQPVFGINPTTIFTALGIGGLAVSLGMKDTIANIIGGFGLMLGRVIQPGDLVNVAGTDGVVEDINWRQTVVRERNGNVKIIPNSILNTASLEKLNPSNEMLVRVPFTAKAGTDIDEMTRQVVQAVQRDTADLADPRFPPKVRLTGYSPYGINVEVCAYAKPESLLPDMINAVARSIANADFLENRAINEES